MSEFTIMRMNDCNRIVLNAVRNSRKQIVFWLMAILLLCLNLGLMNVCESEGSLFVTAREILYGGTDLNAESLTPLSGQIPALLTRLSNVRVRFPLTDPFTLRLPFILSALWLIGCSVGLVRLLKGKKAAELCGWLLLLTSPLWTFNRTACAYVMQCAFSLAAIRWYWKNREDPHWWAQLVFWATVGLAVLTGGIPQLFLASPIALIHILLARKKEKEL